MAKKQCINTCSSCKFWNNKQAELEYCEHNGICTCFAWEFNINRRADVKVLDRDNRSEKYMAVQRFESQKNEVPFGRVVPSRYCFVTNEDFGCIHHTEKKTAK